MHRGFLTLLSLTMLTALLTACGSGDKRDATTTARANDCQMTTAAARAIQRQLTRKTRRSKSGAELIVHEVTKKQSNTITEESPDGRDVFILVNESAGVAGLRGTTGSSTVSLTARRGCGAVAYLRHIGSTSAQFTQDGVEAGGVGPVAE